MEINIGLAQKPGVQNLHMPGEAMNILDRVTCVMAFLAATVDSPTLSPSSVKTGIPSTSSLEMKIITDDDDNGDDDNY